MSMTYSDNFCSDIVDKIYDMIKDGDKRFYDLIEHDLICQRLDEVYRENQKLNDKITKLNKTIEACHKSREK